MKEVRVLNDKEKRKIVIIIVSAIVLLILFFGSFRTIKSGEVGIKVRFGKVVTSKTHDGVNFKMPLIESRFSSFPFLGSHLR